MPCKELPIKDMLLITTVPCAVSVGAVVASSVVLPVELILLATFTLPVMSALVNVFVDPVVCVNVL